MVPIRGRMRVGEVLRVVGPVDGGCALLQRMLTTAGKSTGFVRITKDELRTSCRPARLSPVYEQLNSHYALRPVVVILSHTSSHSPAMKQDWDPLYTGLGLGSSRNVTIVANQQGLTAARSRMMEVLGCKPPEIPRIWQEFISSLMSIGVVKNGCVAPQRERKKGATS